MVNNQDLNALGAGAVGNQANLEQIPQGASKPTSGHVFSPHHAGIAGTGATSDQIQAFSEKLQAGQLAPPPNSMEGEEIAHNVTQGKQIPEKIVDGAEDVDEVATEKLGVRENKHEKRLENFEKAVENSGNDEKSFKAMLKAAKKLDKPRSPEEMKRMRVALEKFENRLTVRLAPLGDGGGDKKAEKRINKEKVQLDKLIQKTFNKTSSLRKINVKKLAAERGTSGVAELFVEAKALERLSEEITKNRSETDSVLSGRAAVDISGNVSRICDRAMKVGESTRATSAEELGGQKAKLEGLVKDLKSSPNDPEVKDRAAFYLEFASDTSEIPISKKTLLESVQIFDTACAIQDLGDEIHSGDQEELGKLTAKMEGTIGQMKRCLEKKYSPQTYENVEVRLKALRILRDTKSRYKGDSPRLSQARVSQAREQIREVGRAHLQALMSGDKLKNEGLSGEEVYVLTKQAKEVENHCKTFGLSQASKKTSLEESSYGKSVLQAASHMKVPQNHEELKGLRVLLKDTNEVDNAANLHGDFGGKVHWQLRAVLQNGMDFSTPSTPQEGQQLLAEALKMADTITGLESTNELDVGSNKLMKDTLTTLSKMKSPQSGEELYEMRQLMGQIKAAEGARYFLKSDADTTRQTLVKTTLGIDSGLLGGTKVSTAIKNCKDAGELGFLAHDLSEICKIGKEVGVDGNKVDKVKNSLMKKSLGRSKELLAQLGDQPLQDTPEARAWVAYCIGQADKEKLGSDLQLSYQKIGLALGAKIAQSAIKNQENAPVQTRLQISESSEFFQMVLANAPRGKGSGRRKESIQQGDVQIRWVENALKENQKKYKALNSLDKGDPGQYVKVKPPKNTGAVGVKTNSPSTSQKKDPLGGVLVEGYNLLNNSAKACKDFVGFGGEAFDQMIEQGLITPTEKEILLRGYDDLAESSAVLAEQLFDSKGAGFIDSEWYGIFEDAMRTRILLQKKSIDILSRAEEKSPKKFNQIKIAYEAKMKGEKVPLPEKKGIGTRIKEFAAKRRGSKEGKDPQNIGFVTGGIKNVTFGDLFAESVKNGPKIIMVFDDIIKRLPDDAKKEKAAYTDLKGGLGEFFLEVNEKERLGVPGLPIKSLEERR